MFHGVEFIDRESGTVMVKGPVVFVPNKGDSVIISDIKFTVTELVYVFETTKPSNKAEMIIRVYVTLQQPEDNRS